MKHDKDAESSKSKWDQFKEENEFLDEEEGLEPEMSEPEAKIEGELEHPDYATLEDKLTDAEQKAHDSWEKLVRMTAELDNVRRRATRDVEQAHRFGIEKLLTSLLPVIDSLEQAIQLVDQASNQAMHEGLALTMKLFLDVLAKQHVTQIDPVGEIFNPAEHEAMSMVDSPDAAPHTILNVFQKGYRLNDRVIRPARVIIVKG